MPVADEVVVKLQAQIAQYKRSLADARTTFDRTAGQIEARNNTMTERMRVRTLALGTAIGTTLGTALANLPGMLFRVASAGLEYASSLGETAQQLGVTSKALQEYRFIGGQVGIENEEMDKSLQFLTRSLGQAQDGAKKPIKALTELGFTAKEVATIIRTDTGDVIPLLADKLSKIENPAKRAAIEIGLFGRAGQRLDTLLAGGRGQIDALRAAVNRLGGVLSEEQIQKADETADKLRQLSDVLKAQIGAAVANNSSAILGFANALVVLIGKLGSAATAYDNFMAKFHQFQADKARQAYELPAWMGGGVGELGGGYSGLPQLTHHGEFIAKEQGLANYYKRQSLINNPAYQNIIHAPYPGVSRKQMGGGITDADVAAVEKAAGAKAAAGGGGKSAKEIMEEAKRKAREAAETLRRYTDDLTQLEADLNTSTAEIIGTQEARIAAEKRNIDLREQQEERRVQADEDYTAAQKEQVIKQLRINAEKDKQLVDIRAAEDAEKENRDVVVAHNRNEAQLLQAAEGLTDDRKERAAIEKRLVALAIQEERIGLEGILASRTATDAQKALARERLAMLDDLQALQNRGVDRANRSPGQEYLDQLNTEMANVNDTLENLQVEKLKELEDYLSGSVAKALGLKGALADVVTELIRIGLQRALIQPIANLLFGGGAGGGGLFSILGGLFGGGGGGSAISSGIYGDLSQFGLAGGGPMRAGQTRLVGERGPELFTPDVSGTVIPNYRLGGTAGAQAVVEVRVVGGEYFDARVAQVSGPVAAQVVRAVTPRLTDLAAAKTSIKQVRPHF